MVVIVSCMTVLLRLLRAVDVVVDGVVVVVVVVVVVLLLGLTVVVVVAAAVVRADARDGVPTAASATVAAGAASPVRIRAANSMTERERSTLTTSLLAGSPPTRPLDSWYW